MNGMELEVITPAEKRRLFPDRQLPLRSKWRLRKTLARKMAFRPIEAEDVKFAWAAYKKGALTSMAGPFAQPNLTAEEFNIEFQATVTARYHGAWTLFAEVSKRGHMPVGLVLAFYSHPDPALSPFMIVADIVWFPWASARNRIEAAVHFFSVIRSSIPMVGYANGDMNKRFFEMICQHGITRRIGTTFNMAKDEPVAVFETRLSK